MKRKYRLLPKFIDVIVLFSEGVGLRKISDKHKHATSACVLKVPNNSGVQITV